MVQMTQIASAGDTLSPAAANAQEGRSAWQNSDMDDMELLVRVARLHYIERETQRNIAKLLGVSPSTVSRLVQQAVDRGIVRFEIVAPTQEDRFKRLADTIQKALKVERCIIAPSGANAAATAISVAREASHLVSGYIKPGLTIGVSGGRTVRELANQLNVAAPSIEIGNVRVVQLMGGIAPIASGIQAHAVASEIAKKLSGTVYLLHAPAIFEDSHSLRRITANRTVRQTTELFCELDIAVVGLGSMRSDSPLLQSGFLTGAEVQRLVGLGAVGDICGRFINSKGRICDPDLDSRTLAISLADLASGPTVIVAAFGVEKVAVIRAAAHARLVHTLVTDYETAEQLAS